MRRPSFLAVPIGCSVHHRPLSCVRYITLSLN